jgi:hypothetical protein
MPKKISSKATRPPGSTEHLVCEKTSSAQDDGVFCLALAHNEDNIILQFLNHYRAMGVRNFIIIDDHSTDKTPDILGAQEDVTVYKPKPGSSYKKDKVAWRCDLLDQVADQRWVLLPDIDEHLIYPDMARTDIQTFAKQIEAQGAQALFTIMVDMYADNPLKDHAFSGGNLIDAFPYFDNPSHSTGGYRLLPPAKRFLKKFPTPPVCAYGGVRDRMFFNEIQTASFPSHWALRTFAHLRGALNPNFVQRLTNAFTRWLTKKQFGPDPLSMTKLGLLKWQKGMKFSGGPHAVSKKLTLARTTGAFLHFKFTRGSEGIKYVANRGQHAGGSVLYQKILRQLDLLDQSPFNEGSIAFDGPDSLIDCGLIRTR